jgi:hypothetical protein
MLWRQADEEAVLHEVDPRCAWEFVAFDRAGLVADGDVELAPEEAWFEAARRDLAELKTGAMWNSNSVTGWLIARSGIDTSRFALRQGDVRPDGRPGS